MKFGNSDIAIGRQILAMQSLFPQFDYRRVAQCPTWTGTVEPIDGTRYTVKITYRKPKPPRVWVIEPLVPDSAPHLYSDGSLCLYYPKDRSWTPKEFIAETIVPWTAEWLAFYEIWRITGKWYGPEAPHEGTKE